MKQTAVEFLMEEMQKRIPSLYGYFVMEMHSLCEQAEELFEEQIKNSYKSGVIDGFNSRIVEVKTDPQEYYNEIFKSK